MATKLRKEVGRKLESREVERDEGWCLFLSKREKLKKRRVSQILNLISNTLDVMFKIIKDCAKTNKIIYSINNNIN